MQRAERVSSRPTATTIAPTTRTNIGEHAVMIITNASTAAWRVTRVIELPVNEYPDTTITGRFIEAGTRPLGQFRQYYAGNCRMVATGGPNRDRLKTAALDCRFNVGVEPPQVGRVILVLQFDQSRVVRPVIAPGLFLGIVVEVGIETGHVGLERIVIIITGLCEVARDGEAVRRSLRAGESRHWRCGIGQRRATVKIGNTPQWYLLDVPAD